MSVLPCSTLENWWNGPLPLVVPSVLLVGLLFGEGLIADGLIWYHLCNHSGWSHVWQLKVIAFFCLLKLELPEFYVFFFFLILTIVHKKVPFTSPCRRLKLHSLVVALSLSFSLPLFSSLTLSPSSLYLSFFFCSLSLSLFLSHLLCCQFVIWESPSKAITEQNK